MSASQEPTLFATKEDIKNLFLKLDDMHDKLNIKFDVIGTRLNEIENRIITIETDLKWMNRIGYTIIACMAGGLYLILDIVSKLPRN